MRVPTFVVATMLLTAAAPAVPQASQPDEIEAPSAADRAQITRLVYDFETAWNRHDMTAFANLFWDDAEWVHWRGGLWSGKKEIYDGHKAVHDTYYKTSQAKVQGIEALHLLSPTVAYVRVRSNMTGDARYPGETFRYRRTMLLQERDGRWLIIKGHNTRIVGGTGVEWRPTRQ